VRYLKALLRFALTTLRVIQKPDFIVTKVSLHPSPDSINPGVIYVVGGRNYQKWAYLLSPGVGGEIIQLCLMNRYRPHWSVEADYMERATIQPSIRRLEGARDHFWIRRGCVEWCRDSGGFDEHDHLSG